MKKEEFVKQLDKFGDALITFQDGSFHVVTRDLSNAKVPFKLSKRNYSGDRIEVLSWTRFGTILVDTNKVVQISQCPVTNRR